MADFKGTGSIEPIRPLQDMDVHWADLERYRRLAIETGASNAKILKSEQVIIEYRTAAKCRIPVCDAYGTNINCPPYAPSPEVMKKIVAEYEYAIFIRLVLPSAELAYGKSLDLKKVTVDPLKIFEIVSKVESQAFYDGYYLAMGLGGGGCSRAFCHGAECNAMIPGKGCRHGMKSRPSMEAVGMNAFKMATDVGWDIYPIGKNTHPDQVPYGSRLGLVLIF
jgi:predicted metal-binding protein